MAPRPKKQVQRDFDDDGRVVRERHVHLVDGRMAIAFVREQLDGSPPTELYFVNGRLVSRKSYQKARAAYPDMPPADGAIGDWGGGLLRLAREEQKQKRDAARAQEPDPARAKKSDAFCRELLAAGEREGAAKFLRSPRHTLGEMDARASRRLVERLAAAGCSRITACRIDADGDGAANTGHLVVALPRGAARKKAFQLLARLAAAQGFDPEPDDGQQLAYLKLD